MQGINNEISSVLMYALKRNYKNSPSKTAAITQLGPGKIKSKVQCNISVEAAMLAHLVRYERAYWSTVRMTLRCFVMGCCHLSRKVNQAFDLLKQTSVQNHWDR